MCLVRPVLVSSYLSLLCCFSWKNKWMDGWTCVNPLMALPLTMPALIGWGIVHWSPLSVRLSVCPVPDPKLRTEGHGKLKIGRKEAHDTGDQWPNLEVERSKFKVTRQLNASIPIIKHIFGTGRRNELQAWYTGGTLRRTLAVMTSRPQFDECLPRPTDFGSTCPPT